MIHLHYFITRKPALGEEEFHRYWRETHAPIVKRIPQLRGYLQTHRIPFASDKSSRFLPDGTCKNKKSTPMPINQTGSSQ